MSDECPLNPSGHKFFLFKAFETYEFHSNGLVTGTPLYQKIEYAVLGCNCGRVIRTNIKEQ